MTSPPGYELAAPPGNVHVAPFGHDIAAPPGDVHESPPLRRRLVRRRELVLAAAGAALVRPSSAAAAEPDPGILRDLIAREHAAALAYERAAPEPLPGIAAQERDHVAALRTMLDAFALRTPPPQELDEPARRLAEAPEAERLEAAIALEASLIADYAEALLAFEEKGVLQSAASILASHAQHHARLRSLAGLDPFG